MPHELTRDILRRIECCRRRTEDGWGEDRSLSILCDVADKQLAYLDPLILEMKEFRRGSRMRKDRLLINIAKEWAKLKAATARARRFLAERR
jgi:hypothetical protein